jgi:hypothetical protein
MGTMHIMTYTPDARQLPANGNSRKVFSASLRYATVERLFEEVFYTWSKLRHYK